MQTKNLGILAKTLFIVCTLVVALTLCFLTISFRLVTNKFQELEINEARLNLERVINDISGSRKKLETMVGDWAPWDDTYNFIQELNQDFIDKNLSNESFQTLGLHFMLFFDEGNQLVYSRFHDPQHTKTAPADTSVIFALKAAPGFFLFDSHQAKKSGIIRSKTTPVFVASAPIVTSTYKGPPRGTLVFGRYLDESKIKEISAHTRVQLEAFAYDQASQRLFSSADQEQIVSGTASLPVVYQELDPHTLRAYTVFNDILGHPSVVFAVNLERRLLQQGRSMWKDNALSMIVLGAVFISVLVLLLNRIILHRLTRLGEEVGQIAQAGGHDLRVTIPPPQDEIGVLASGINEMLAALEALRMIQEKNEQHLKDIIDSINCGIMLVAPQDRRIISINRAGAAIAGRRPEEIVGRVCHQFICPRERLNCPVLDLGETIDLSERTVLHTDGRSIPVLKSVSRIERQQQTLLVESFIDISELKDVQAELAAREAKYRKFFEEDLTGNFISSHEGTLLDCNPAFAEILGYDSPEQIIGQPMMTHYLNPDMRKKLLERLAEKGRLERYESVLRHRSGQPVHIICNVIGDFDDQGQLQRIRGYIFDDTKRVFLEKELRQTQKLEAIGTMAGGIAHDFNNILAGIIGYTEIVLRDLDEAQVPKSSHYLRSILSAGERARGLIEKMLTFSRQTESERQPVSLSRILEDALHLIRVTLPSSITIAPRISNPPNVLADPIQMHQVFMNLCTNAGHAMKEQGGTLSISLEGVHLDTDFTGRHPELTAGEYAKIHISDTGKGIPAHMIERIFDPFFTTKRTGEGTGLGLSMVHGIVKAMHGLISVESQEGLGTSFTIYLPTIKEEEVMAKVEHQSIPTGHEHVVYVDDEGFLVDIGSEILRGLGYAVTGFTDSQEALDYLRKNNADVDLLISDMTMPALSGIELARQVQNLDAPPPVIICTGHSEGLTQKDIAHIGVHRLLLKPVTVNKLAQAVREVLDNQLIH